MLQKHDKFREETLVREQAMREKYEETYEKCQTYYNETQALLQENNNMKVMHVEQLITFDALVRTKDLELRAARKIIEFIEQPLPPSQWLEMLQLSQDFTTGML